MKVRLWLNPELNLAFASYYLVGLSRLAKVGEVNFRIRPGLPEWSIDLSKLHRASELFQFYAFLKVQNNLAKCPMSWKMVFM